MSVLPQRLTINRKFALSGSVNILALENTANAYIGVDAQINQDETYAPSPSRP